VSVSLASEGLASGWVPGVLSSVELQAGSDVTPANRRARIEAVERMGAKA
jgi:hypothetical protein